MTFQYPTVLWALFALLPLAWLWRVVARRQEKRLEQFAARDTWRILAPEVSRAARRRKAVLLFAATALAIIAAARPLWGTRERVVRERGVDIIVAIDVSRSMLARDVAQSHTPQAGDAPTRLDQARSLFRQLLGTIPGQRVGILPFAGDAFLQCPLTTDYGVAMNYLLALGPDTVGTPGTNITAAIERARAAFSQGGVSDSRVLLLITDGENFEGDVMEQARLAAKEGLRIFALGIGTTEGSPIFLEGGSLAEDSQGHKVLTRLDAGTLRDVADATGGHSFAAKPGETIDIRPLAQEIAKLQKSDYGPKGDRRIVREERFQFPLALALALLLFEGTLGERRRVAPARSAAA